MRPPASALALALMVGVLAGCAETDKVSNQGTDGSVDTFWATTIDGRKVPCLSWSGYEKGGLSCDWSAK